MEIINSEALSEKRINTMSLWMIVRGYLERLPGAMKKKQVLGEGGETLEVSRCIYTPHSLGATTATLLLDAGVDITKVQELVGMSILLLRRFMISVDNPNSKLKHYP